MVRDDGGSGEADSWLVDDAEDDCVFHDLIWLVVRDDGGSDELALG